MTKAEGVIGVKGELLDIGGIWVITHWGEVNTLWREGWALN